jgi:hypothetical protein
MGKGMGERMDRLEMARTFGEKGNDEGGGTPERMCPGEKITGRKRDERHGFVHALWLLVVLSAFLFGATLVNVGIGMKIYEASSMQSIAIEKLTLSVKEVRNSVLYLSKIIEETEQADEEYSDRTTEDGRI